MSPSGDSIFTTSAPRSASRRVQCGPAIVVVKSTTRMPASASFFICGGSSPRFVRSMAGGRAKVKPGLGLTAMHLRAEALRAVSQE